ncbi:hypothetical protein [Brevundimonas sp.]|uniref:hypothetical protein n=1 Tax=Brevundimonas sp. TaxID=1871086 RepID=UPI0028AED873|nr:hypothetical protein [Brevundimonas sp.]
MNRRPSVGAPSAGGGLSVLQDAALDQTEDDRILEGCGDFTRKSAMRLGLVNDQALTAVSMRGETEGNLALLLCQTFYPNQLHTRLIS